VQTRRGGECLHGTNWQEGENSERRGELGIGKFAKPWREKSNKFIEPAREGKESGRKGGQSRRLSAKVLLVETIGA